MGSLCFPRTTYVKTYDWSERFGYLHHMSALRTLSSLNRYISRYTWLVVGGTICITISNLMGARVPVMLQEAIDSVASQMGGLQDGNLDAGLVMDAVVQFVLLSLLFSLLRGIFLFFTRQTLIVMSRKVEYDLRNDLYAHLQELPLSYYRRNRTGDLMARMTEDVGKVRMYLGPAIMYLLNTITQMVIVLVYMIQADIRLTLWALAPMPVLAFVIYKVESVINRRSERIQEQLSVLSSFTQETFSGIRVIKAFVQENAIRRRFSSEAEQYQKLSMKLVQVDALFQPSVVFLVGLSLLLTVWIGAEQVIAGKVTIGTVTAFLLYVNNLIWPIVSLGWITTLVQTAAASQSRINEVLQTQPEITFPDHGPTPGPPGIEFSNVALTYPESGVDALKDVSFSLPAGRKLGVVGPTGSGKTTLVHLLARLYDPVEGTVTLGGHDVRAYPRDVLRNMLGYAPQDVFLFSETIRHNITFGTGTDDLETVRNAATSAAVLHNVEGFTDGFETVVGERGVTLSGGQKQRIALARAWIRNPSVLIWDDTLSAVDMETEEAILTSLAAYRSRHPETTVVVVAHRLSAVQDADLILCMDHGRIAERGTHAELLARNGYYARIWEQQQLRPSE